VLFLSGYAASTVIDDAQLAVGFEFLAKPFTPSALLSTVRKLLNRHEA